ncbi:MAG: DNA repair protein RecO [Elusimicrobia bacterium RIFOXYA2_FULL_39_19]|nr:MAG: DNA repair protein RecO [Elusimicrobia bacterium RIFOXYA2_FULL_39_19]
MEYKNTSGIVLYSRKTGEVDKYLHILTYDLGKVKATAVGSRKITAKLLAATEPVTETDFSFYINHKTSRIRVVGGILKNMFNPLKTEITRYSFACATVNLVDSLTPEYEKNIRKYVLLKRTLELLETTCSPDRIYLAFALRFLKLCGYGLELNKCIKCENPFESFKVSKNEKSDIIYFSLKDRGLICENCTNDSEDEFIVFNRNSLHYIRQLAKISGLEVEKLTPEENSEIFVEQLVRSYINEYTPYSFKTQMFVKNLDIR